MVSFSEAARRGWELRYELSGRATRAEYWWYCLLQMIWFVPAFIYLSGEDSSGYGAPEGLSIAIVTLIVSALTLTVFVRRCHDIGLSGWWVLPGLAVTVLSFGVYLPGTPGDWIADAMVNRVFLIVSGLYYVFTLIICIFPSAKRENRFGPNPHTGDITDTFS